MFGDSGSVLVRSGPTFTMPFILIPSLSVQNGPLAAWRWIGAPLGGSCVAPRDCQAFSANARLDSDEPSDRPRGKNISTATEIIYVELRQGTSLGIAVTTPAEPPRAFAFGAVVQVNRRF
jgi:hypothetical protein